jgi:hypothetical protein
LNDLNKDLTCIIICRLCLPPTTSSLPAGSVLYVSLLCGNHLLGVMPLVVLPPTAAAELQEMWHTLVAAAVAPEGLENMSFFQAENAAAAAASSAPPQQLAAPVSSAIKAGEAADIGEKAEAAQVADFGEVSEHRAAAVVRGGPEGSSARWREAAPGAMVTAKAAKVVWDTWASPLLWDIAFALSVGPGNGRSSGSRATTGLDSSSTSRSLDLPGAGAGAGASSSGGGSGSLSRARVEVVKSLLTAAAGWGMWELVGCIAQHVELASAANATAAAGVGGAASCASAAVSEREGNEPVMKDARGEGHSGKQREAVAETIQDQAREAEASVAAGAKAARTSVRDQGSCDVAEASEKKLTKTEILTPAAGGSIALGGGVEDGGKGGIIEGPASGLRFRHPQQPQELPRQQQQVMSKLGSSSSSSSSSYGTNRDGSGASRSSPSGSGGEVVTRTGIASSTFLRMPSVKQMTQGNFWPPEVEREYLHFKQLQLLNADIFAFVYVIILCVCILTDGTVSGLSGLPSSAPLLGPVASRVYMAVVTVIPCCTLLLSRALGHPGLTREWCAVICVLSDVLWTVPLAAGWIVPTHMLVDITHVSLKSEVLTVVSNSFIRPLAFQVRI